MNATISPFIWPAIAALIIKLYLLYIGRRGTGHSTLFVTLVIVFACHNFAEILGFFEFSQSNGTHIVLRWYYVMSLMGLGVMSLYAVEISRLIELNLKSAVLVLSIPVVLAFLTLFSDLIVAGTDSLVYSPTASKGPYFWAFLVYSLAAYTVITTVLVIGYRRATENLVQIQCSSTLLALAPITLLSVSLVALISIGIQINASALIPIATTLFLYLMLRGESEHRLSDIRRFIPGSLERQATATIMQAFSSYARDETTYRDAMAEIERMMVVHKHEKKGGNVSSTAASMDLPRSSLYSIFRRLNIDPVLNAKK